MKCLSNQKGYSLAELVVSLPLSLLVFVILIIGVLNFLKTYEETKLFTQLQDELFMAIEIMRHGYATSSVTEGEGLIGLISAKQVTLDLTQSAVLIRSVQDTPALPYYSKFYIDQQGYLRVSGNYGTKSYNNVLIFPTGDKKINGKPRFKILNPVMTFYPIKSYEGRVSLLGINMEAQVRFREKRTEQSTADDIRMNTKKIKFETSVFIN